MLSIGGKAVRRTQGVKGDGSPPWGSKLQFIFEKNIKKLSKEVGGISVQLHLYLLKSYFMGPSALYCLWEISK